MENSVSSYDTVMDTSHYQPCCTTQANVPVCLLLGALEYAHDGVLSAVSVRVLRVYRRKMACGVNGGTREEKCVCVCVCVYVYPCPVGFCFWLQCSVVVGGHSSSVIQHKHLQNYLFPIIIVTHSGKPLVAVFQYNFCNHQIRCVIVFRCDLVRRGQSKAVTFTNLKLTKKTNAARYGIMLQQGMA